MLDIVILKDEGLLVGISMKGHVGYAPLGEDIVCSAISALFCGTIIGLQMVVEAQVDEKREDGDGHCFVRSKIEESQILLKTFELSVQEIEKLFPNLIRVRELILPKSYGGGK